MHIILAHEVDMATWRQAVRYHIAQKMPPESLSWHVLSQEKLFAGDVSTVSCFELGGVPALSLPRALVDLILLALQAKDPERFSVLYSLIYRMLCNGDSYEVVQHSLEFQAAAAWAEYVRHATGQFRAACRAYFQDGQQMVWHSEPECYCLEANAVFCRALIVRPWEIRTPYRSMKWDGRLLSFGSGDKSVESALWQTDAQGVWSGYPNTVLIPTRQDALSATTLNQLGAAATECRACELWQPAQRMVFGEGAQSAQLMLVGEQPGDQEDKAGRPFVGPAGQVLDRALQDAGLARHDLYISNAVKHFRFTWRGNHRLHQKPTSENITACRVWLDAEKRIVQPKLLVMLGATAAQSLLGRPITISRERSRIIELEPGLAGLVTVHPSYLLRLQTESDKAREYERFVGDLRLAQQFINKKAE